MATRSDKAKNALRDKHQVILSEMLKEEANRTCADCHAKGPRWASWNIGVFLCIRCAGIHRNLGVHVSKVKSVNLDAWTPEQIDNIVQWGNLRAKDVYECYLPNDFTRPQGDSAMETFIRSKYERKLYMVKGDIANVGRASSKAARESKSEPDRPSKPPSESTQQKVDRPKSKAADSAKLPTRTSRQPASEAPSRPLPAAAVNKQPAVTPPAVVDDLLSMNDIVAPPNRTEKAEPSANLDLFSVENDSSGFGSYVQNQFNGKPPQTQDPFGSSTTAAASSSEQSLFPEQTPPVAAGQTTKDSIMSLYKSTPQQQQQPNAVYGVPGGVYMPNSTPQPGMYNAMPMGNYPQQYQASQGMMPRQMPTQPAAGQLPHQMQQMNLNGPAYGMAMGTQQQQGVGHFGGMNPNQQQQHHHHQAQYYPHNMAANMMGQGMVSSNSSWQRQPMMTTSQPLLIGGHQSSAPAGMQQATNGNTNSAMGHTLSNQLWN